MSEEDPDWHPRQQSTKRHLSESSSPAIDLHCLLDRFIAEELAYSASSYASHEPEVVSQISCRASDGPPVAWNANDRINIDQAVLILMAVRISGDRSLVTWRFGRQIQIRIIQPARIWRTKRLQCYHYTRSFGRQYTLH